MVGELKKKYFKSYLTDADQFLTLKKTYSKVKNVLPVIFWLRQTAHDREVMGLTILEECKQSNASFYSFKITKIIY
jgi:hypothetical protein